jgi:hypothetical protein
MRQTQLNVVGLVLIGSARLSRSHFQIKNELNSYCAGAHCNLITLVVSTLYSAGMQATTGMKATTGPPTQYVRHQKQGCLPKQ